MTPPHSQPHLLAVMAVCQKGTIPTNVGHQSMLKLLENSKGGNRDALQLEVMSFVKLLIPKLVNK